MQEIDDALLETYEEAGLLLPALRLTGGGPPQVELLVGGQLYRYQRSFPIKGHSAVMPAYLREQLNDGKKPLVVERPDRFYVYLSD
jgi:hypothetical protein